MIATADQRGSPFSVVGKKRDYISHSAISTYQQCPLRYRFKYVDGIPERFVSSNLIFGGAIHSALEFHFTELLCGNEPPSQDLLLTSFRTHGGTARRTVKTSASARARITPHSVLSPTGC